MPAVARISNWNCSVPSVKLSTAARLRIVPVLFIITTEPSIALSVKSVAITLPASDTVVQYKIVPFGNFGVVSVNVTPKPIAPIVPASFIEFGVLVKTYGTDSLIVTSSLSTSHFVIKESE